MGTHDENDKILRARYNNNNNNSYSYELQLEEKKLTDHHNLYEERK